MPKHSTSDTPAPDSPPPDRPATSGGPAPEDPSERRGFLAGAAGVAMVGGLAGGYGTFFAQAGRFLFPARAAHAWFFVAQAEAVAPGESLTYESPDGALVVIKRAVAKQPVGGAGEPTEAEYVALSSVCPHLGCRVHWEPHNDRFFCPCHNGEFDPEGHATGGPPLAAKQSLPRYPLKIERGLLFIEMPIDAVRRGPRLSPLGREVTQSDPSGAASSEEGESRWS